MAKDIESTQPAVFKRPALLEGNRKGKTPVPVGKWVWPGTALALAVGTTWGAQHIEAQVDQAAPQILAKAGVDTTGLDLDTSYRTVNVSGLESEKHSRSQVENILAMSDDTHGVDIRKANVSTRASINAKPATVATATKIITPTVTPVIAKAPPADVRASAVIDNQVLTLNGTVPSQDDVDMLYSAAKESAQSSNVINNLQTSGKPVKNEATTESINNLATLIANFDDDIIDAHIDLDNELLTGNITTANAAATNKVQAYLPTTTIGIITDYESQLGSDLPDVVIAEPDVTEYHIQDNQVTLLQGEVDQLESHINDQVVFAPDSTVLSTSASLALDDIIAALYTYPDTSLEVSGHTDSQSSATYNLTLSRQRAEAVTSYITSRGIEQNRLTAVGLGESHPIATNDTKTGRAQNRRVELRAY